MEIFREIHWTIRRHCLRCCYRNQGICRCHRNGSVLRSHGALPASGVHIHVDCMLGVRRLRNGLHVSLEISDPDSNGKLQTLNGTVHPRVVAPVRKIGGGGLYGFASVHDISVDPSYRELFEFGIPHDSLTLEDVIVHRSSITWDPRPFLDGEMVSFLPKRMRVGKHAGKLTATDIRFIS